MSKTGTRRPARRGRSERDSYEPVDGMVTGRKFWQILQWVGLAALVGYAAHQSHYIMFRASYFKLQRLSVVGNRVIPEDQLVMMSGLELGMPIFDVDTSAVVRRVHLLPRVERVSVEQKGPNEILLSVVEKQPAVRIQLEDEPLEVAADGAILGFVEPGSEPLPWVLGAEVLPSGGGLGSRLEPRVVEGLVTWLPLLERSPLASYTSIAFPSRGKVAVMWRDTEFFMAAPELFTRHVGHIEDLLALERDRGRRFLYIDFRFQDIVARFHPID